MKKKEANIKKRIEKKEGIKWGLKKVKMNESNIK